MGRRMFVGLALSAAAGIASGRSATADRPDIGIGYRGDRTGVYEGSPPVSWNEETGENVLWKTPLPHWGHGSPVVAGRRVFVVCEPGWKSDWPIVVCVDAETGRILWQKQLDHLAIQGPPSVRQARAAEAWHEFLALDRKLYRMSYLYRTAHDKDQARQKVEQAGLAVGSKGPGGVGVPDPGAYFGGLVRTFNRADLYFEVWHWSSLHCVGYAFPTPVTDGKHVYVATGLHGFACYDLDGNVVWQRFDAGEPSSNAGYGGNDYCKNARSPLLYGDLLISDVGDKVRAFDKHTGELVWSDEIFDGHEIVSPVVITSGGRDILLCENGHAYLLPEGRKLAGKRWANTGTFALVRSDQPDTAFFSGGGEHGGWKNKGKCKTPPPAAVRFTLRGQTLDWKVLWSGVEGVGMPRNSACMLYHRGRLYWAGGFILDPDTGQVIRGLRPGRKPRRGHAVVPRTRHMLAAAGGHIYGLEERRVGRERGAPEAGVFEVYDLDGEKVAANTLSPAPSEGPKRRQIICCVGKERWGYSFSCPFAIAGDRIYARSNDHLYCIGRK